METHERQRFTAVGRPWRIVAGVPLEGVGRKMAICPYFKENQCIRNNRTGSLARSIESMRCATEQYIDCPIYGESGRRVIADERDKDPEADM